MFLYSYDVFNYNIMYIITYIDIIEKHIFHSKNFLFWIYLESGGKF